jgi:hypothetical protein
MGRVGLTVYADVEVFWYSGDMRHEQKGTMR